LALQRARLDSESRVAAGVSIANRVLRCYFGVAQAIRRDVFARKHERCARGLREGEISALIRRRDVRSLGKISEAFTKQTNADREVFLRGGRIADVPAFVEKLLGSREIGLHSGAAFRRFAQHRYAPKSQRDKNAADQDYGEGSVDEEPSGRR
jgi:hypothetical protein